MSDEDLDPGLLRSFANANELLSGAEFQARVMNHLHHAGGWRGMPRSATAGVLAACSGFATGISAPFRLRIGVARLLALLLGAILSCIAMLSA